MDVKNLRELLKFIISGYKGYLGAKADGKIGFEDLGQLMLMVPHAEAAFKDIKSIPAEIKDIDPIEAAQLIAFVKAELSLAEDTKAAKIIDAALGVAINGYKLYQVINDKPEVTA